MPFIGETKKAIKACKISHRDLNKKYILFHQLTCHTFCFELGFVYFALFVVCLLFPKITTK